MISHKLNEIAAIADSITILRDGRTIETLEVADGGVDEDRIIQGMVGRDLEHRFPPYTPDVGDVLFEVKDWNVYSPVDHSRAVVIDANLVARRGEIVGIAGLMGAGRTELARSIFGKSYGARISGTLVLDGKELELNSVADAISSGLAYVTEDRKSLGLNLLDDIKTSITSAGIHKLAQRPDGRRERGGQGRRGLPHADEHQGPDSRGQGRPALRRQPAEGRPEQVDLHRREGDDPRRADPRDRRRGQVRDLRLRPGDGQGGNAVIVISSELPELLGLCDRIYTLAEGHITGEFVAGEATQEVSCAT